MIATIFDFSTFWGWFVVLVLVIVMIVLNRLDEKNGSAGLDGEQGLRYAPVSLIIFGMLPMAFIAWFAKLIRLPMPDFL